MKQKTKNKKSGNSKYLVIGIIVIAIIGIFMLTNNKENSASGSSIGNFAKCLTEKGAVMYGTFWCPHCAKTKKMFGESFNFIKYVECDPRGDNEQSLLCINNEIDKYDTWEFADGSRLISEQTFAQLSEKTGCPIPN